MTDDLEQRIQRLETHLAHLERQHEELNQVVIDQDRVLRRLLSSAKNNEEFIRGLEIERIRANNPPPPHYQA